MNLTFADRLEISVRTFYHSIFLLFLVACNGADADQAKRISDNYLSSRPDVDLTLLKSEVRDRGQMWEVVYSPRANAAGGGPTIIVRKSDGSIEKVKFYQ